MVRFPCNFGRSVRDVDLIPVCVRRCSIICFELEEIVIHVFGLGECGSRIALDLFAQLYPNATIDDSPPPSALRRCWETIINVSSLLNKASAANDVSVGFQLGPISITLKPHIFIGDLNKGNTNYRRYLAAQRIRELARNNDRDKCKSILKDEGLLDERIQFERLYELVVKQGEEQFITLLRFAGDVAGKPADASFDLSAGMAGEGAGGNQIYSELAAEKYQVHQRLEEMEGAKSILVGIFSIGGGTGAGSANQIFRALASKGYSYTLGVAVMPTWDDLEQRARAGRYLAKYLRVEGGNRSRGLLLISNQAAGVAMRGAEGRSGIEQASSLAAVNEYALNCLKAILLLRATTLRTIEGKQLDFMDMSTWMSGMFSMGYACQHAGINAEVDLWPHVIRAIAPMSIAEDQQQGEGRGIFLEGLSVSATERTDPLEAENECAHIRENLLGAAESLANAKNAEERDAAKGRLRQVGDVFPLYGTIKRCTFLIFVPSTAKITNLPVVKDRLRAFFNGLTGNQNFDLSFNVYSIEGLTQIEVVAFPRDCLAREVVMHVLDFTSKGFASEADPNQVEAARQFIQETWDQLAKVFATESSGFGQDAEASNQKLKKILETLTQHEQMFELRQDLCDRVRATQAEAEKLRFQATDLLPVIHQFRLFARALPLIDTSPPPMKRGGRKT